VHKIGIWKKKCWWQTPIPCPLHVICSWVLLCRCFHICNDKQTSAVVLGSRVFAVPNILCQEG
jgi:hypothetical protein